MRRTDMSAPTRSMPHICTPAPIKPGEARTGRGDKDKQASTPRHYTQSNMQEALTGREKQGKKGTLINIEKCNKEQKIYNIIM